MIGHRGSAGNYPENTMAAFREGVISGADKIELDLQLTKDNVPFVSHDATLNSHHCWNPDGSIITEPIPIPSLTAAEAVRFNCGNPKDLERPPTFEEVLIWRKENMPQANIVVHVKEGYDPLTFAPLILEPMRKHDAISHAITFAFTPNTIQEMNALEPNLKYGLFVNNNPEFCQDAQNVSASMVGAELSLVTLEEVQKCHELGITVYVWTVNNPKDWEELIKEEVDGIITDYPRRLETYLEEKY